MEVKKISHGFFSFLIFFAIAAGRFVKKVQNSMTDDQLIYVLMQQFGAHIRHELLQISKKKQGGKKELGTSNIIENFTILNARVHFYCTTNVRVKCSF